MKTQTFHLELITPCFCGGAEPEKQAEIRAPSIRGQLRWWFRTLGGSAAEEKELFGGVHKLYREKNGNAALASKVFIRTSNVVRAQPWQPFSMKMGTPGAYIWYFASVSADKKRWWRIPPSKQQQGQPNPYGNLPPGTTFTLHLGLRGPLAPMLQAKLDHALECFLRFGALGMRATRCMGDFHCAEVAPGRPAYEKASDLLTRAGFAVQWYPREFQKWEDAVFAAEHELKALREQYNANKVRHSPLGNSSPRQTSAVWFRVVKFEDQAYGLVIFEAPHARVLGLESRRPCPLLKT